MSFEGATNSATCGERREKRNASVNQIEFTRPFFEAWQHRKAERHVPAVFARAERDEARSRGDTKVRWHGVEFEYVRSRRGTAGTSEESHFVAQRRERRAHLHDLNGIRGWTGQAWISEVSDAHSH